MKATTLTIGGYFLTLGTVRCSQPWIAGYTPRTFIADQSSIDLDSREIDRWLDAGVFERAEKIYKAGGHARSYARLKILNAPEPPIEPLPAGTLVYGTSMSGKAQEGRLLNETIWKSGDSDILLTVAYAVEQNPGQYCQVGGMENTDSAVTDGCFIQSGFIEIIRYASDTTIYRLAYEYDVNLNNVNALNIQTFSKNAAHEMLTCDKCPKETFKRFVDYYGIPDYGDNLISAAFQGGQTDFRHGNVDFSEAPRPSRGEAIKVATKFMNVWMETVAMMERAIDQCEEPCTNIPGDINSGEQRPVCADSAVRSWDQAVAFYAGSLEGESGAGDGMFLFNLADQMCSRFLTCGTNADMRFGMSNVNNVAIEEFLKGQISILNRECGPARMSMTRIIKVMGIPLVQATLYTTYERIGGHTDDDDHASSLAIQGVSFAATVLPLVHNCTPSDAEVIYNALRFELNDMHETFVPDYDEVKKAFERNYECMGITCKSVGGISSTGHDYLPYAMPCQDYSGAPGRDANHVGFVLGVFVGILVVGIMTFLLLKRIRMTSQIEMCDSHDSDNSLNLQPTRDFD